MKTITMDLTNALAEAVGANGIDAGELTTTLANISDYYTRLLAKPFAFMTLPETKFQFDEMLALADKAAAMDIKNLVILGIGGSSLGTQTIFEALLHPLHNMEERFRNGKPRYFILDNIDPHKMAAIVETVIPDIDRTFLVVISKSGETPETISQFMLFNELMRRSAGYQQRIVLITDKEKGLLNRIAEKEGYPTLNLPDGVGGRFSVLTPVGLFPSALMGLDIKRLSAGAAGMAAHTVRYDGEENMAFVLAAILYLMDKAGKKIHVVMPYCERLAGFADWFRQLEAESLGKKGLGPTPTRSMGVTDQHSQLQLYVEGPKDKCVILFYSATQEVPIPASFDYLEDVQYLANKDMKSLFHAEFQGTRLSLTEAGTPNISLLLDEVSDYNLGALFYLFEMVTAIMGHLLSVNAFDQPGVEQGKIYTKAMMGKKGLEKEKEHTETLLLRRTKTIVF
ncbi:MAG: Glucose-6-phosphate isomerase [Syntrophorhabdus sp. PtaB.Bin184]|jgi:glucose-6-phosphate isomerase|nr:MAG: Glucose-6-phosphate isomerase [Syntrophorhabdus sp. PtaB.Bin184]